MKNKKSVLSKWSEDELLKEFMEDESSHEFSKEYENQKICLLQSMEGRDHAKKFSRRKFMAAAAAAVIIAMPASAFAAKQVLSSLSISKNQTGAYQYQMEVNESAEGAEAGDTVVTNPLFHTSVQMKVNYVPEGYTNNNGDFKYALNGTWDSKQNVTVVLAKIDADEVITESGVVSTKDLTIGGKKATLFYRNATDEETYNKHLYVLFEDYGYVVEIYGQVNVPEEEMIKMAENVTLESCDASVATEAGVYSSKDQIISGSSSASPAAKQYDTGMALGMNTPITMKTAQECWDSRIEYTVEDYEIRDSIAGLSQGDFAGTWSDVSSMADADGNLTGYVKREINRGDGINTLDEVVSETQINVKLVYVTMKVKNTSDVDIDSIKIAPQICCMNADGSIPNIYAIEHACFEGRPVLCDMPTMYDMDSETYGELQKYAQRYMIKAGEEREVHVAYLVDETRMDNMVLFFNGNGRIYEEGKKDADNQQVISLTK